MVRFEKELWKFSEVRETRSVDETNKLLSEGWKLLEANASGGKRVFILGWEKTQGEKERLELDKEIEKVLERKEGKIEDLKFESEEKEQERLRKEKLKALVLGPVFLALGLWLFFEILPKKLEVFGVEYPLLENVLLFASVVLIIAGLANVLHFASRKEEN